jgi:hypothetical protein
MATVAVTEAAAAHGKKHFAVRTKDHRAFLSGTMKLGALAEHERLKMILPQACCYYGSRERLSIDHLISKSRGGPDLGENTVWACRSCNSSKHAGDVLIWYERRAEFPPLYLLRRYWKLAEQYRREHDLLELPLPQVGSVPFELNAIPLRCPGPSKLVFWAQPPDDEAPL